METAQTEKTAESNAEAGRKACNGMAKGDQISHKNKWETKSSMLKRGLG